MRFQFQCLPFGLSSALRIFTELMKPVMALMSSCDMTRLICTDVQSVDMRWFLGYRSLQCACNIPLVFWAQRQDLMVCSQTLLDGSHATGLLADQVWWLTTNPTPHSRHSPRSPLWFTHSFYRNPEVRYWATGQFSFISKCLFTQEVYSHGDCEAVDPKESLVQSNVSL